MTATGSPSSAAASTAAATAAAPAMSLFIVTMPEDGLMFRPPESKVMPLPTSATEALAAAGAYDIVTIRGGLTEPCPTPTMPPKPPFTSAFSSSTDTVTFAVDAATRFLTLSANDCGNRSFGGVLTRSRAQSRAAAQHGGARDGVLGGLPWPAPETTMTRGPGRSWPPWPRPGCRRPAARRAVRPCRRCSSRRRRRRRRPRGSRGRGWAGPRPRCACRARCAGPRRRPPQRGVRVGGATRGALAQAGDDDRASP